MACGKIVAVANQKGGVGKTTSAVNLSAALARLGMRVLLVDFDPQANATSSLGYSGRDTRPHVYDVLSGRASPQQATVPVGQPPFYLLPSNPDLAGAEIELAAMTDRVGVLRDALGSIAENYDLTLLDCPPSLSVLTVNALVAARDGVLIPVQCEYLALEGLSRLVETVEVLAAELNPGLRIVGILMTMYDVRTNLAADVVQDARRHFPSLVFREAVPRSVRLSEAPSRGLSVLDYAPSSAGALAYIAVARELSQRLGLLEALAR